MSRRRWRASGIWRSGIVCITLGAMWSSALPGRGNAAESVLWSADDGVGINEVVLTLSLACTGPAETCTFFDGYADTQVSNLSGIGTVFLDAQAGTLRFETDSQQDLDDAAPPHPAYITLVGSDVSFAGIPFYGVPEVLAPTFFSLDAPLISLPGFDLLVPADHPFTVDMSYAGVADITGALSLVLPRIVVPPASIGVSGVVRILGDVDLDGMTEIEIRDLSVTTQVVNQYADLGVLLDISVDAELSANLSAEIANPADPPQVPALGATGIGFLAALMSCAGGVLARARRPGA